MQSDALYIAVLSPERKASDVLDKYSNTEYIINPPSP